MAAYITFDNGNSIERMICGAVVTIGRDKSNHIALSDLVVSRNHATIRRLGSADFYIIDSGSSNGTWLNQRRITTPTLLCDGDRVGIGDTELVFEQPPHATALVESVSFQATMMADSPLIKEITILVADIRGFTSMSEQLPIQLLTRVMNQWFNSVSTSIEECGGTVDKFIGDCVFARWESDSPCHNVVTALQTACAISAITEDLNRSFPELPNVLRVGAGIHTGLASIGIGSENTALGDSVNTAFRLESATKELGTDIVLSESSYSHLPSNHCIGFTEREIHLKGKSNPVKVIALGFAEAERLLSHQNEGQ